MSYDSRVYGEITITPPLPYAAFRESLYRMAAAGSDTTLIFNEEVTTTDTATGVNHDITATGIVVRYNETGRHYNIKRQLQEIVDNQPVTHEYSGALIVVGRDAGDIMRYRVERFEADSAHGEVCHYDVIEEKAVMTWPDGTKVEF